MARKKRHRPVEIRDYFYCTPEVWKREYHFGAMIPERKYDESGHKEWDHIVITTKVRHHETSRVKSRRDFEAVELCLSPDHALRGNWSKEARRVGGVLCDRKLVRAYVDLASDVYYSLIPCLAAGHIREITVSLRDLRYSRGDIQWIGFNPEETPSEDL